MDRYRNAERYSFRLRSPYGPEDAKMKRWCSALNAKPNQVARMALVMLLENTVAKELLGTTNDLRAEVRALRSELRKSREWDAGYLSHVEH